MKTDYCCVCYALRNLNREGKVDKHPRPRDNKKCLGSGLSPKDEHK